MCVPLCGERGGAGENTLRRRKDRSVERVCAPAERRYSFAFGLIFLCRMLRGSGDACFFSRGLCVWVSLAACAPPAPRARPGADVRLRARAVSRPVGFFLRLYRDTSRVRREMRYTVA